MLSIVDCCCQATWNPEKVRKINIPLECEDFFFRKMYVLSEEKKKSDQLGW